MGDAENTMKRRSLVLLRPLISIGYIAIANSSQPKGVMVCHRMSPGVLVCKSSLALTFSRVMPEWSNFHAIMD